MLPTIFETDKESDNQNQNLKSLFVHYIISIYVDIKEHLKYNHGSTFEIPEYNSKSDLFDKFVTDSKLSRNRYLEFVSSKIKQYEEPICSESCSVELEIIDSEYDTNNILRSHKDSFNNISTKNKLDKYINDLYSVYKVIKKEHPKLKTFESLY